MAVTYFEAIALLQSNLGAHASKSALLSLVDKATPDAQPGLTHGSVTVLCSGGNPAGGSTEDVVRAMLAKRADVRVINATQAAAFLESFEFRDVTEAALRHGRIVVGPQDFRARQMQRAQWRP